jgi:hypothetical protein
MARINIPAPALAALQESSVSAFALLLIELDGGPLRLAGLGHDVEVDGNTYMAAQHIGSIEPVSETATEAAGLAFTLSAVPPSAIASALTEPIEGRRVTLQVVVLEGATPHLLPIEWQGTMDSWTMTRAGGPATLRYTAEHAMMRWARATGQRFCHADHSARFPGDRFFEFVTQVAEQTLVWPSKEAFRQ